jgi:hypothetical protein
MGFDAMFFGRMDDGEEGFRRDRKELEWIHRPNNMSFGTDYQLLFHKLKNSYVFPPGFSFDILWDCPPFEADKNLDTYNAIQEA